MVSPICSFLTLRMLHLSESCCGLPLLFEGLLISTGSLMVGGNRRSAKRRQCYRRDRLSSEGAIVIHAAELREIRSQSKI